MTISAGTKIGERYLVERRVGRGGFATVYLAQDLVLQRNVAIKVITPEEVSADSDNIETYQLGARLLELLSEARFIARHHHANILDVYDFGQVGDEAYLVMPYASEGTLLQKLRATGRFSYEQTGRYLDQMAAGLDYAHSLGVIHRDIKPQNIFVFSGDHLVIGDFGLAKVLSNTEAFSNTRASGTPSYMPPEQFGGRVSKASDIYSLGVVVFQMLTGQLPFAAQSQAEMMYAHINTPPPPLRLLRPDAPAALEEVLLKALAKNPTDRPATAGDFARLYHEALAHPDGLADLRTVPITTDGANVVLQTQAAIPTTPAPNPHQVSTYRPDIAPVTATAASTQSGGVSTRSGPLTEEGPISIPPPRTPVRKGLSFFQFGLVGGALVLVAILAVLLFANLGSNPNPTKVAVNLPTQTPNILVVTATPDSAATINAGVAATLTSGATIGVSPSATPTVATPTATPELTSTPTATATAAPQAQPDNNQNQGQGQTNPNTGPVVPNNQNNNGPANSGGANPITATSTPTATPTATKLPTPTPCGIATRRGFGQVYTSRQEVAQKLGCPLEAEVQATLAYQPFSGGFMVYSQAFDQIYVFYGSGSGSWQRFPNTFHFTDPTPTPFATGCATNPINGFMKVWATNSGVKSRLGCPLQAENSSAVAASERFNGGIMFYYPSARNGQRIYVVYNDGTYLDLPNTFVG